jgi:hypothetical protein
MRQETEPTGIRFVWPFDADAADEILVQADDEDADAVHLGMRVTYVVSEDDLDDASIMMTWAEFLAFGEACVAFARSHMEDVVD